MTAGHPDDLRAGGWGCPDGEALAEYVEGSLDGRSRDAIEIHLADCARCRAALAETMAFLKDEPVEATGRLPEPRVLPFRRSWWRTGLAAAVAAAAAFMIVSRLAPQWLGGRGNPPALKELIAAVAREPTRPIEGRLTGGFGYGPPPPVTRGIGAREVPADVQVAALQVVRRAADNETPANLAASGVAYLTIGDYEKAVRALERAVQREPANARFLTDLSAAYLARARWVDAPDDWNHALSAAERALALAPGEAEAYFNRALALEGLHRDADAKRAWEDYRTRDSSGQWSEEALSRASRKSHLDGPRPGSNSGADG